MFPDVFLAGGLGGNDRRPPGLYAEEGEGSLPLSSYLELRLAPATHTHPKASLPRSVPAASPASLPAGVPSAKGWSLVGPATPHPDPTSRHDLIHTLESEGMILVDPPRLRLLVRLLKM
jgi:hypothetical protein